MVEIDPYSGFCNGVVRAIDKAEAYLAGHSHLYSLGAIVHNTDEIRRLEEKGLRIINSSDMEHLAGETVLVRAHGEPPATYALAARMGITLIDCTCPVVLKLQERIEKAYRECDATGGTVVIFGKRGHAEVNGLVGRTEGHALVIEDIAEISKIDFSRHIERFSQTTKDPDQYQALCEACMARTSDITIHNTICHTVAERHRRLAEFASSHDVILFVSGRDSSNGKVLEALCRQYNPRTYWVENVDMLDKGWLEGAASIGICGATSTPRWQLEQLAAGISQCGQVDLQ
ncbi:MAG: 4-hydroxy-3-methylbut-2-enyl diphosphate reductase [Bacteroidales bacterium]|nr:4-hydroxy-3-methylbut-2-enyl diphosphate reductase [Candidatus Equibacterium intestinale]